MRSQKGRRKTIVGLVLRVKGWSVNFRGRQTEHPWAAQLGVQLRKGFLLDRRRKSDGLNPARTALAPTCWWFITLAGVPRIRLEVYRWHAICILQYVCSSLSGRDLGSLSLRSANLCAGLRGTQPGNRTGPNPTRWQPQHQLRRAAMSPHPTRRWTNRANQPGFLFGNRLLAP
jgi:hypothetical protein